MNQATARRKAGSSDALLLALAALDVLEDLDVVFVPLNGLNGLDRNP